MRSPLQQLTSVDLRTLATAIEAGRLGAPFVLAAVQRYCGGADDAAVATELQQLVDGGGTSASVAYLLEVLADERESRPGVEDLIDLVWTGPEVPGTANRDTRVVVRELFSAATDSVLVAGYAIHQGRDVFRAGRPRARAARSRGRDVRRRATPARGQHRQRRDPS